jgi:predicted RNase H-like nuclease
MHRQLRNGAGAGLPVWGIVPKMREVNLTFESDPALQSRAFEFHPELTWKRLAQGRALQSKKTLSGILERIALLNHQAGQWLPFESIESIAGSPMLDDVLDSIAGVASAAAFLNGAKHRLPQTKPPRNAQGLRMEIWH